MYPSEYATAALQRSRLLIEAAYEALRSPAPSSDTSLMRVCHLRAKGRIEGLGDIAGEGANDLIAVLSRSNDGANHHDILVVELDVPILRARARAARGAPSGGLGQPGDEFGSIGTQHPLQHTRQG